MVKAGRDLWISSCPTPLLKLVHLETVAWDRVQTAFEYLQGVRLNNIPGQLVPVFGHPHSEKVFLDA